MTHSHSSSLEECSSFVRGYLLASDWAGRRPEPGVANRTRQLAGEEVIDLYDLFRRLPRASREALRVTWPKREGRCRLDEVMGLHPSWLAAHLDQEPATTLLVALGEMKPELGREVLRSLWPRVKPSSGDEVEIRPLPPAWSGELRRWLFRRFVHSAPSRERNDPLHRLVALDAQQIWLLTQDLGRDELTRIAQAGPAEIDALMRCLPPHQAAELARWVGARTHETNLGDSVTDTMQIAVSRAAGDRRAPDPESFRVASEHVRAVLDLAGSEANHLGTIGLRSLAAMLAGHRRAVAQQIAQRIGLPLAERMLSWRDELELRGDKNARVRNEEILRKVQGLSQAREMGRRSKGTEMSRRSPATEVDRVIDDGTDTKSTVSRRDPR